MSCSLSSSMRSATVVLALVQSGADRVGPYQWAAQSCADAGHREDAQARQYREEYIAAASRAAEAPLAPCANTRHHSARDTARGFAHLPSAEQTSVWQRR